MNSFLFKKSRKFVVALTTALLLSLTLTGCGGAKPASETTPAASAAPNSVIKIGIIAPLTGPAARTGQEFKDSINMAFGEINNKVGEHPIEFKWIDSESDAEKGARAYESAIVNDKITVGFMDWHSWVSVSCMEVAAKYKMPHFFSYGATDVVNQKYKSDPEKYAYWMGKAWPTPEKLSIGYVSAVEEAIKKGLWKPENKKVALFGVDNDWGRGFCAALGEQYKAAGWEVVTTEWVGLGETEFYPLLNKLKGLNVSLVAGTMSDPSSVSSLIKQSREVGLKSLIASDGLGWVGEWYKLTGDASDYVIDQIPQWTTPEAKKFQAAFVAKYNYEPGAAVAGMSYDYTKFLIKVLEATEKDYGAITTENLFKTGKEKVMTGQLSYKDGILMKEYKYTPETFPDPVIDGEHYMFPVVQYFGGKPNVIWPEAFKDADLKIPANLK
ncbi:ABC transporter substrate-binding protein [Desulfosporosinus fructosivorans]